MGVFNKIKDGAVQLKEHVVTFESASIQARKEEKLVLRLLQAFNAEIAKVDSSSMSQKTREKLAKAQSLTEQLAKTIPDAGVISKAEVRQLSAALDALQKSL